MLCSSLSVEHTSARAGTCLLEGNTGLEIAVPPMLPAFLDLYLIQCALRPYLGKRRAAESAFALLLHFWFFFKVRNNALKLCKLLSRLVPWCSVAFMKKTLT